MASIKPLPGYIVVTPYKEEKDKKSGMSIPDTMNEKDGAGEVIAVGDSYTILEGPQQLIIKSPVKVGDKIIFSNYNRPNYLDFQTGKHIYLLKFHTDPRYTEILGILED